MLVHASVSTLLILIEYDIPLKVISVGAHVYNGYTATEAQKNSVKFLTFTGVWNDALTPAVHCGSFLVASASCTSAKLKEVRIPGNVNVCVVLVLKAAGVDATLSTLLNTCSASIYRSSKSTSRSTGEYTEPCWTIVWSVLTIVCRSP